MTNHTEKSRIPGFYRLDVADRHREIQDRFGLNDQEMAVLSNGSCLGIDRADKMVENCVGVFSLPMGLGLNFVLNGKAYAVPMVVEEPSVVAAVSNMARLVGKNGECIKWCEESQFQGWSAEDHGARSTALETSHEGS